MPKKQHGPLTTKIDKTRNSNQPRNCLNNKTTSGTSYVSVTIILRVNILQFRSRTCFSSSPSLHARKLFAPFTYVLVSVVIMVCFSTVYYARARPRFFTARFFPVPFLPFIHPLHASQNLWNMFPSVSGAKQTSRSKTSPCGHPFSDSDIC